MKTLVSLPVFIHFNLSKHLFRVRNNLSHNLELTRLGRQQRNGERISGSSRQAKLGKGDSSEKGSHRQQKMRQQELADATISNRLEQVVVRRGPCISFNAKPPGKPP